MNTPSITYIPFGDRNVHDGYRIDGSKIRFWASKEQAAEGVKSIGWPVKSLTKVHTRFCNGWAISDGYGHMTKESFDALYKDRNCDQSLSTVETPDA